MFTRNVVRWTPRILSVVFVVFLSLFATDVFSQGITVSSVIGFAIHLIPSLALLIGVLFAWRYPLIGTTIFGGFGVWYIWEAGFGRPWTWYAVILAPAVLVAVLFALEWHFARKEKEQSIENVKESTQ